jgi:3-oxoadipate CoA-transferase beta subunit
VLDIAPRGFVAREIIPGLERRELEAATGAPLAFAADCRELITPAFGNGD